MYMMQCLGMLGNSCTCFPVPSFSSSPSPSLSFSLYVHRLGDFIAAAHGPSSLSSVYAYIPSAEVVKLCHAKVNVFLVLHCKVRAKNIYSVSTFVTHLRGERTVQIYDPTLVHSCVKPG